MDHLADTNMLVRFLDGEDAQTSLAVKAIDALQDRGDRICIVPQNLFELWAVCTRPLANNGLELSPVETRGIVDDLASMFYLYRDTAEIYDEWLRLVTRHGVSGKRAHDARLVAAMRVHGLTSLLTFNVGDFRRYPGITLLDPRAL